MSARTIKYAIGTILVLAAISALCTRSRPSLYTVENAAYRLTIDAASGGLRAVLDDKRSGLRLADGPLVLPDTCSKGGDSQAGAGFRVRRGGLHSRIATRGRLHPTPGLRECLAVDAGRSALLGRAGSGSPPDRLAGGPRCGVQCLLYCSAPNSTSRARSLTSGLLSAARTSTPRWTAGRAAISSNQPFR